MKKYCVLLLALLCTAPALADVYKWKDEKGVTHYGDDPRDAGKGAATVKTPPPKFSFAPNPDVYKPIHAGDPIEFNGLPAATIAQCQRYARQAADAELDGRNNAVALHNIEATCPGVSFMCHTFINKSRENFCDFGLRSDQPRVVEQQVFKCSAACGH